MESLLEQVITAIRDLEARAAAWEAQEGPAPGDIARRSVTNTFSADQIVQGNLTTSGDIYLGARSSWLSSLLNQAVRSDSSPTFAGLSTSGSATVGGTLNASGSATVGGDLTVQNQFVTLGSWSTDFILRRNAGDRILYLTGGNGWTWNGTANGTEGAMLMLSGNSSWRSGLLQLWAGGSNGAIEVLTNQARRLIIGSSGDSTFGGPDPQANQRVTVYGENSLNTKHALVIRNALGSNLFYASNNGYLWANQAWTTSERELKAQIQPLQRGIADVRKIQWRQYVRRATAEPEYGVIADEFEGTIPELVAVSPLDNYRSVNYTGLVPMLGVAIQELDYDVEELKAAVAELRAALAARL